MERGSERSEAEEKRPRRLRALAARLALALLSLLATVLALEILAVALAPVPPPRHDRDGLYHSTLPLVNGRPTLRGSWSESGKALAERKAPGELRVFVYGESSVEGCPWGHVAAPPSMVHDRLVEALPDREVTVVNMGRTSSFTVDTYYYLLASARFEPDFVVFYQGMNDRNAGDAEICLPLEHPALHRAWRWLVSRSRLLWTLRALGPERLGARWSGDTRAGGADPCVPGDAFQAWTDILVETGRDMGAEVVVATPLASAGVHLDYDFHRAAFGRTVWEPPREREAPAGPFEELRAALGAVGEPFRGLLECQLKLDCEPVEGLEEYLRARPDEALDGEWRFWPSPPRDPGDPAQGPPWRSDRFPLAAGPGTDSLLAHGHAWKRSAARAGAHLVDFFELAASLAPRGLLQAPLVVDEVHLSPEGYWLLAGACSDTILDLLGVAPRPDPPPPTTLVPAPERYRTTERDALLSQGLGYIRKRMPYTAAGMLRMSVTRHASPEGELLLGWLRSALGLPHDLPPALAPHLDGLKLDGLCQREQGCRWEKLGAGTAP